MFIMSTLISRHILQAKSFRISWFLDTPLLEAFLSSKYNSKDDPKKIRKTSKRDCPSQKNDEHVAGIRKKIYHLFCESRNYP